MPRYITEFLLSNRDSIQSSSLTADQLIIEVKEGVSVHTVCKMFAELIDFCRPVKATMMNNRRLRLEFQ